MTDNHRGAVHYSSAGEVNPTVTLEWNQFKYNGRKLYGNFTTAEAAIVMDVQNTQNVYFRVSTAKSTSLCSVDLSFFL